MSAAVLTHPTRLIDTRRPRGKHRARRAARVLAFWRSARLECALTAAAAGAMLVAAHGVSL